MGGRGWAFIVRGRGRMSLLALRANEVSSGVTFELG